MLAIKSFAYMLAIKSFAYIKRTTYIAPLLYETNAVLSEFHTFAYFKQMHFAYPLHIAHCDDINLLAKAEMSVGRKVMNMRAKRTHWSRVYYNMSLCVRNPTFWVSTRSYTNWTVQSQKMARGWKFWI